jgi:hypothetical protein
MRQIIEALPEKSRVKREYQSSPTKHTIRSRLERVTEDLKDLNKFYNIKLSSTRQFKLKTYYKEELDLLKNLEVSFDSYSQDEKIDYLLLKNHLQRCVDNLNLEGAKNEEPMALLYFSRGIIELCERRQRMEAMDGKRTAQELSLIRKQVLEMKEKVRKGFKLNKTAAYRTAKIVDELRNHLKEWFGFYDGYHPLFTWWAGEPYAKVAEDLEEYAALVREKIVGIKPGDEDAIIGDPVLRGGLVRDLEREKIPYTPEELLDIADKEFVWCETEMNKASRELGYGDDWKKALDYVKDLYVEPGEQDQLVHSLATEAIDYVKKHDLITVPPICENTWRMFMMSPKKQKTNPFFLGGDDIDVSYPTDTMDHEFKLMILRGNNIHFSRATVFHELIPGHHLHFYMMTRHKPYRRHFWTPFCTEGWAFFWEMILWDKKSFAKSPENKVGMLFWRMHRCARIIFSLKFHLGHMTPQECINFLVEKVGHERATAEGEVRRSFNGDYSPLYQAGYMLGGIQLYCLRNELVGEGKMTEKQFHDRIMMENQMPIEFMRALIKEEPLTPDFKSSWRFYDQR